MPVRPIVLHPDPALRRPAAEVTRFDADLAALATDLLDTMRAAPGIGITACHVGVPLRVVVLELEPGEVTTWINPVVEATGGPIEKATEGSISLPGFHEEVERPRDATVRYRTLAGEERVEATSGLLARCLLHEIDQLDGIFWLQRLSRLKRERLLKKVEKAARPRG